MAEKVQQKQDLVDFNKQNKSKFSNISEICRLKSQEIEMEENDEGQIEEVIYNKKLEDINFGGIITKGAIENLIKKIQSNPDKITYNFAMKRLTIKAIKEIAYSFTFLNNLIHLDLHIELNEVTDQGITYIAQGISQLTNLQVLELYCGWSKVGPQGIHNLGESLSKYCLNINHIELYFSRSDQIGSAMEQFALLVQKIKKLQNLLLYLWENKMTDQQLQILCAGLQKCQKLNKLTMLLGKNDIGEVGVQSLANSIKQIPKLTYLELDLGETLINGACMNFLGRSMLETQYLNYLKISYKDNPQIIQEIRQIGQMKKNILRTKRLVQIKY
ncbi:kinase domain protein, putative (macronuclear) [Tetrahymena thermophila SB210]|uniref:Kinase domain protein, putative n=1 Tax=Tetrahymena thermophila (strain SB210) TaxID=312017 RepID=W7XEM7_TETTS|nr:kinase domain protein, putative [Tetrahymena thermophila SB210]EWS72331.1 kinase domain protein, putative [Tetrahymena thermophila SB210]|eukprot:XP_012655139.1 kinase domain protein, putative [Tetrahymena thermophila SB210]